MTQAGPLTLTPSSSLAPASGWLAQIGTFVLLAVVGLLVLPPLLYLAAAALKAGELGAVTIGSLVGLAAMTLTLATLATIWAMRSEEHTSELQSLAYLVCRLLLEKKKKNT